MSHKDKRSRLEKLLCILEDSRNDQTLRFAAQKIADVALQQPHHIPSVLRQVHLKLYSREWKARVYAGDVLADLAQRVEHCTVECLTVLPSDHNARRTRSNVLANFSLNAVLLSGATLVSGNQSNEPEVLSFDEVRAQLSTIKAQFALDISCDGTHAGEPINGSPSASPAARGPVVKIEACTAEAQVSRAPKRKHCETENEASPTATASEAEGSQHNIQSARERNRIKRQVKSVERQSSGMLDAKTPSVCALPAAASEQSAAADDEQESERIANGGWPFQRVAEQLVANLLDANWQVRHGAAVGLRQLLRAQASSAAVQVPIADPLTGWRRRGGTGPMERSEMTQEQQSEAVEANYQWLQDTMAVLLVLLVLDRFADYHNDSATAPVRETAAQAIAFAAAASPQSVRQQLLEQLINMQLSQVWEVRHGSMMCIKCIMAVDTDAAGAMVHRMLPVLMQGMRDSDDDVRACAVQACVPLADKLVQKTPGMVSDLITCLWELLPSFDEVSPAPASVLQLLGILTAHCLGTSNNENPDGPAVKVEGKDGAAESGQTTLCRETANTHTGDGSLGTSIKAEDDGVAEERLDKQSGPARATPDGVSYLHSFAECIPSLWPFFDHSSTQVRTACVACCTRVLQGLLSQKESASRCSTLLHTMLRLAYQVFVAAADPELFSKSEELMLLLLKRTPRHTLAEALDASALYALMDLPCTPVGAPLPSVRLLRFPLFGADGVDDQNGGSDELGGISTFKFGEQNCEDTENAATSRRIACARMVGLAASATGSDSADTNKDVLLTTQNFSNLIATYLYSSVALQRSFGALVMMSWMQLHAEPGSVIPEGLKAPVQPHKHPALHSALIVQLFKALEDAPTVALQDTAAPMQAMHACLGAILEAFSVAGTPIQLPPEVTLQSVTTVYATDILNSLDATYGDLAVMQRQACRDAVAYAESVDKVTRLRLSAVVAAACVSCEQLPDKVSSVIQPLMAGLRNIQETSLQKQVVAAALANVITMCIDSKPAAVAKVLSHLRSFACTNTTPQSQPSLAKGGLSSASLASFPNSPSCTPPLTSYACAGASSNDGGHKFPEVIAREGAEAALQHVVSRLGGTLPERLPQLWTMFTAPVVSLAEHCKMVGSQNAQPPAASDASNTGVAASCFAAPLGGSSGELAVAVQQATGLGPGHMREAQMAADAMQLLNCVAPALDVQLHRRLAGHVGQMMLCMVHVPAGLRGAVCEGVVRLTSSEPSVYLDAVVTALLPCIETSAASCERSAGTLLLAQLLAAEGSLMVPLLPYAALLTVPTLALMTDPELGVRTTAAAAFGRLMSILPMAVNQPLPELATLDATLREKRKNDLRFLEQLMDSQSVTAFDPPVTPQGVTLRAYQLEGVSWLAFLQKCGLHGVLADDMGLGKTVQTLTIIACSMAPSEPPPQGSDVLSRVAARGQLPSLIVCPATLLGHWVQETKRYFGHIGLETVRYQGSAEQRQAMQRQVRGGVLVVASYESVRADALWFSGLRFQYCALDEGHIIRNSKTKVTKACKQIVANHRLVLSGTPVQNNVTELWSLFDFLMPGYLGTESEFNSKYKRAATMPRENSRKSFREKHVGSQLGVLDSLHKQILPFVLRRTKEQVLDDLPPKIIQDIVCELTPLQHRLYEVAMAGTSVDPGAVVSSSRGQPGQSAAPVFNVLQRLRKLCSHPSLMLDLQDQAHLAALRCSFPSLNVNNRAAVDAELSNIEQAPKLLALRQLLSNAGIIVGGGGSGGGEGEVDAGGIAGDTGQHRVLCFAQMKGTLDLVESVVLDPEGVSYLRLDGDVSPAKRSDVVHQFNTDPTVDVMLLTTAAGCHGLNLTTANVVVFLEHDWNPMKDMQAMDRAHRLGQRRTVTVYRLLTEGTLEEHIMSLQQFKVDVAKTVVNADNVAMGSMDTGAVLDLMSGSAAAPQAKEGGGQREKLDSVLSGGAGKNGGSQIIPEQEDTVEEQYNEFSIEQFMHTIRPKRKM